MGQRSLYIKMIQSTQWRLLRNKILRDSPLCVDCAAEGINTYACEIHHVRPVESAVGEWEMKALCFDSSNLVALCHDCHVKRHIELKSHTKENVVKNNKRVTASFIKRFFE